MRTSDRTRDCTKETLKINKKQNRTISSGTGQTRLYQAKITSQAQNIDVTILTNVAYLESSVRLRRK